MPSPSHYSKKFAIALKLNMNWWLRFVHVGDHLLQRLHVKATWLDLSAFCYIYELLQSHLTSVPVMRNG
jgi:hypothetical protein